MEEPPVYDVFRPKQFPPLRRELTLKLDRDLFSSAAIPLIENLVASLRVLLVAIALLLDPSNIKKRNRYNNYSTCDCNETYIRMYKE